MAITVSLVCHRTPLGQLERAVECVLECHDIENIYIIDNGPEDSLKIIKERSPLIEYRHIENKGYGNAHNLAIKEIIEKRKACGQSLADSYHIVMNTDVYWEGDIIKILINYMDNHKENGMVMPKVFYPDGDLQFTCRMLPGPTDVFFKRFLPEKLIEKRMEKYLLKEHDHDVAINCPYLLGSFLLFRLEALDDCGLFDERFFMYPEDIDITRRIHEKWKTMYWPNVKIIHEHAAASRKNLKMFRIHAINMVKYFNKWGWFYDPQRKDYNKKLRESIKYLPEEKRIKGRG